MKSLALALGLALINAPATAAGEPSLPQSLPAVAQEPRATLNGPVLEVEMAPAIQDAETLSEWIHQESLDAFSQLEPSPDLRGTIRVSVSGSLYDYQVSIATLREGSTQEDTLSWSCECSNEDLLVRIRVDVQAAAKALQSHDSPAVDVGVTASPSPPSPPQAVGSDHLSGQLEKLQMRGKVGLGLMASGSAGILSGVILMGMGRRPHVYPEDSAKLIYNDYRIPGIPVFLVGVGLLAAGTTLFVLDRRSPRMRRGLAQVLHVVLGRQSVIFSLTRTF